ncbi:MAG: hypothetical protein WC333_00285 [Dehalococcoidia bacterium]|jgi:hypothetical protein
MKTLPLKVTWKMIRRAGYGRTKETYCTYIAENGKYKHKLRTEEGTKLFEILATTVISHNPKKILRFSSDVYVDGVYKDGNLMCVKNPRVL